MFWSIFQGNTKHNNFFYEVTGSKLIGVILTFLPIERKCYSNVIIDFLSYQYENETCDWCLNNEPMTTTLYILRVHRAYKMWWNIYYICV